MRTFLYICKHETRLHFPLAEEAHLQVIFSPWIFFILNLGMSFSSLSQCDPRLYMVFFHVVRAHSQLVQQLNAISYLEEHARARMIRWSREIYQQDFGEKQWL